MDQLIIAIADEFGDLIVIITRGQNQLQMIKTLQKLAELISANMTHIHIWNTSSYQEVSTIPENNLSLFSSDSAR